ncbi:CRISPR-associated ring nuclease Csm6 [Desulfoferrobacter suflitae]|uniref:CRISPR-associated ring nuclease Csm6 n=1 Tax=Desulfoferrobacter suflitae TaxID=2865782 RepID=UPI002164C115|nr:CRISPR-associated ring nuclease Csm6 [Desulfoferrobacter suflitae]MCK8603001.1 CRISPR-associated ring nuclease Csm6 [Desulfoferrobacter suflitae]
MPARAHVYTRKNILVAVAGQTPAIVTETLWALEQQRAVPIDEIRVITTSLGEQAVMHALIGDRGKFGSYCRDYGVAPGRIAFSEKQLYVLSDDGGRPLPDIRTSSDNRAAADQVYALIKQWTARRDDTLFCSAAGGRKTLGIYLAMALMLCGRAEDRLLHVLVSPQFESGVRDFFYPPPEEQYFQCFMGLDGAGDPLYQQVSSSEAQVELADIPFVRLRDLIGGELPLEKGLIETVGHCQLLLSYLQTPPKLLIQLDQGLVQLGRIQFSLSRQLVAVYAFFLRELQERGGAATTLELFEKRLRLAELERLIDRSRSGEQERYAWETMQDLEDFRARLGPCVSKVNRAVNQAFGKNRLAERYRIATGRSYRMQPLDFAIFEAAGRPWGTT